jgi:hypothetical protein
MPPAKQLKRSTKTAPSAIRIKGIDLFCGAGGLTRGLEAAGIDVVAGAYSRREIHPPFAALITGSYPACCPDY